MYPKVSMKPEDLLLRDLKREESNLRPWSDSSPDIATTSSARRRLDYRYAQNGVRERFPHSHRGTYQLTGEAK